MIACDRRQLRQRAREPARQRDQVLRAGEPVEVGDRASSDDRVVIAVRDHGIGIPRRDLERIFERFYRVDRARSRETGGTGLGLAIVRHVAQAHGGDVTVESVEGAGSTFRLALPLADSADAARVRRAGDRLMADPPLILVVDDEQSYRDALAVALEREGFLVEVAADGAEAIERFDAARPRSCCST